MSVISMQKAYINIIRQWYGMEPDDLKENGIADPFYSNGVVNYEDLPESIWNKEFFEEEGVLVLPLGEFDLVMARPEGKLIQFPVWLTKSTVI